MTEWDVLTSSGRYKHRIGLASPQVKANAAETARRCTLLLTSFNSYEKQAEEPMISSGFRDKESNARVGGAKASAHLEGMAVDIFDPHGRLALFCVTNQDLLKHFQLWVENPNKTKGWVHIQTRPVPLHRIFEP